MERRDEVVVLLSRAVVSQVLARQRVAHVFLVDAAYFALAARLHRGGRHLERAQGTPRVAIRRLRQQCARRGLQRHAPAEPARIGHRAIEQRLEVFGLEGFQHHNARARQQRRVHLE